MRAFLALLMFAASSVLAAAPVEPARSKAAAADPDVYIVQLVEQSVSLFDGRMQPRLRKFGALKATRPDGRGQRKLDIASADVARYRSVLRELRGEWLATASAALGRKLVPLHETDLGVNGFVLRLDAQEAERLRSLPAVRLIEPSVQTEALGDASAEWIRAVPVWQTPPPVGNRGEGVVIGIIDSGIQASHPSFQAVVPSDGYVHRNPLGTGYLGLCVAKPWLCNDKLIGIYDFATCTAGTQGCTQPGGNDGRDSDDPHGSQVAGIAAGNPIDAEAPIVVWNPLSPRLLPVRVSGIAPRANIVSYRTRTSAQTIAAIEAAIASGVDVLNLSFVTSGSATHPWSEAVPQALLSARAAGISVAVSGGNNSSQTGLIAGNAPWTLAVASSTHHRRIGMRLSGFTGGEGTPAARDWLAGADCYHSVDAFACPRSAGSTEIAALTRLNAAFACAPENIAGSAVADRLVVCDSAQMDDLPRSAELLLAQRAAGIVILTRDAQPQITLSGLRIPALVLRPAESAALIDWLGAGTGHRARLQPLAPYLDEAVGDRLADYSSVGPSRIGPALKPEISAPGEDILTASSTGSGLVVFAGTSASSPQLAGAMALVRAARPEWDVDAVESALLTTASPTVRSADGSRLATAFEQGSGRIDVERAVRAGLGFPQPISAFIAADPRSGGDLGALNRPSAVSMDCADGCRFQRRVRDLVGGGEWRVEIDAPPGLHLQVTPSQFRLAANAEQALDIEASPTSSASLGAWLEGSIRLVPVAPEVPTARLPLRVFHAPGALPERLRIELATDRGFIEQVLDPVSQMQDLRVALVQPAVPQRWSERIAQHPTPSQALLVSPVGSKLYWVDIEPGPEGAKRQVQVALQSQTARDLDLLVGRDSVGDGQLRTQDVLCRSISTVSQEACSIEIEATAARQRVWLLVHAYAAGPTGEDAFELEAAVFDREALNRPALVATAPTQVDDGRLAIRVAWELPDLVKAAEMRSELQLAIGSEAPFARIPVVLARAGGVQQRPRILAAGATATLGLAAGAQHPGLVVEVPAHASALSARLDAAGDVDFSAVPAPAFDGPRLPSLDAGTPAAVGSVAVEGGRRLRVEGAALKPGRWYLIARNRGQAAVTASLSVEVESAVNAPGFVSGAYYNPARSGSGAYIHDAGDARSLLWYAYLQDGTPTWYLAVAARPVATSASWRASLLRFGWNGTAAVPTEVGEVVVTTLDGDSIQFAWNLDGESGTETYRRIGAGSCPPGGLDLNGTWYPPQRSGIGFSIVAGAGIESHAVYLYDDRGLPRWLVGSTSPFGAERLPLSALSGSCPLCDYRSPQSVPAGELLRSYGASGDEGRVNLSATLPGAFPGRWQFELPIRKLTSPTGCTTAP